MGRYHFVFPKWSNLLLPGALVIGAVTPLYAAMMVAYGFSPKTTDVGYQPVQPVPFSHELHAGQLGLDCRYCHNTVERAAKARDPADADVHELPHADPQGQPEASSRCCESYETGMPVEWQRVHDLPDYAYFNHSAHVTRGVSCVSCHGRDRHDGGGLPARDAQHGLVPRRAIAIRIQYLRDPSLVTRPRLDVRRNAGGGRGRAGPLEEPAPDQPVQDCSTCHR